MRTRLPRTPSTPGAAVAQTGTDVPVLAQRIRDDVLAKYDVALDFEPSVLGVD